MSNKQQISDSLEAEVEEEGSLDVGSSETNPLPKKIQHPDFLPTIILIDVPALISDEIANFPEEPKNPEVTRDPLEQSLGADDQPSQANPGISGNLTGAACFWCCWLS